MATKKQQANADLPLKLGKLPASGNISLKFGSYADLSALPTPPPTGYGHSALVKQYPMYGNDQYGDCVFAGAAHEHQLWRATGRSTVSFTDAKVLAAYSAVTGFNIDDPSTDQGTDMERAASWRRKTGMQDAAGARHKVAAFADLKVGSLDKSGGGQLGVTVFVFGAAGIGIEFPGFAMDQFNAGKPWDISRRNTKIEGGHYIPIVGFDGEYWLAVTWGRVVRVSTAFLLKYMDEGIVYFSTEVLYGGRNLEGLNQTKLLADLRGVTSVRAVAPSATASTRPSKPGPAKPSPAKKPAPSKVPAKAVKAAPAKKTSNPAKSSGAKKR